MPSLVLSVQPGREPYSVPGASAAALTSSGMNKVPEITFAFSVMKICATTLGETAGDLLSMTLNVGYAASSLILIGAFLVTLLAQLGSRSFHPFLYWGVILSTSTAGTAMSDYMDRTLGLGYAAGALILVTILISILALWALTIGSLSVSNIRMFRVELSYWTAILFSNTLGTGFPGRQLGSRICRRRSPDREPYRPDRNRLFLHADLADIAVLDGVRPDTTIRGDHGGRAHQDP
jgi:hypothetical protein